MKITTVIPAYKSKYIMDLLTCLVQQTEPPDRVIFSDDTPDYAFAQVLYSEPIKSLVAHLNVTVVEGPRKGAQANWAHCLRAWGESTELVHLLCDDDVVYPHFYAQHRKAHLSGEYSASVSRRWYANEKGQPLHKSLSVPEYYANLPNKFQSITARELFATSVGCSCNWLGEMSNTVMRKGTAALALNRQFESVGFAGLEDLGAITCGSIAAPICFINEHLGYFRLSPDQNSSDSSMVPTKLALLAYLALALVGKNARRLTAEEAQGTIVNLVPTFLQYFQNDASMQEMNVILPRLLAQAEDAETQFLLEWSALQRSISF